MAVDNKICAFTGQRTQNPPWSDESDPRCIDLTERLYAKILKATRDGYRSFVNGFAVGIDVLAVKLLLRAKRKLNMSNLFIEAAIPCKDRYRLWNQEQKNEYARLLAHANLITVLSEKYTNTCMCERNLYMASKSSLIIAVADGRAGGTTNTIKLAQKQGKRVFILSP